MLINLVIRDILPTGDALNFGLWKQILKHSVHVLELGEPSTLWTESGISHAFLTEIRIALLTRLRPAQEILAQLALKADIDKWFHFSVVSYSSYCEIVIFAILPLKHLIAPMLNQIFPLHLPLAKRAPHSVLLALLQFMEPFFLIWDRHWTNLADPACSLVLLNGVKGENLVAPSNLSVLAVYLYELAEGGKGRVVLDVYEFGVVLPAIWACVVSSSPFIHALLAECSSLTLFTKDGISRKGCQFIANETSDECCYVTDLTFIGD